MVKVETPEEREDKVPAPALASDGMAYCGLEKVKAFTGTMMRQLSFFFNPRQKVSWGNSTYS